MPEENNLEENIISALKLKNLPDNEKAEIIDGMAQLVQDKVILRMIKELSKEDAEEFDKIKEDDQDGKIKFLQDKFPDLLSIINEEIKIVRNDTINRSKESWQELDQMEKETI